MNIQEQGLTVKGTKITIGNEKRILINKMINMLLIKSFTEINVPILQYEETFKNKIGEENSLMMYRFKDTGDRNLCLTPEVTAVIQKLASKQFKYQKDVKLFYVHECFRAEAPQKGRFRQFTQLGVEILNPSKDYSEYLVDLAKELIDFNEEEYLPIISNVRGLDYYTDFTFELQHKESKLSVCGGGSYQSGIGFAIGADRIIALNEK
jgi:histidyl-tRNA synthetase